MKLIKSEKRNCLLNDTLNKLMFIKLNNYVLDVLKNKDKNSKEELKTYIEIFLIWYNNKERRMVYMK